MAFHGAPRFTGDLDILVRPDAENVNRLLQVLRNFGFPTGNVSSEYLLDCEKILQLGQIPVQIHLMTSATGITWDQAWASRKQGVYASIPVLFIGREALIANKRAAARSKDLADVEALERFDP